ncbi:TrwC protein [Sphingomonas sp. RIT328]|nr:TrwC protein [Sphingomonas sp. RIT328]
MRALAPTVTAAETLGKSIDAEPMTVASLLLHGIPDRHGPEAWIVDEASLLSARDAQHLLARTRDAGARLVLSGDRQQLGSVGAGKVFEQLQRADMTTVTLKEIVRQTTPHTRAAIEALIDGRIGKALDHLDAGAGRDKGAITEHAEADIRRAMLVRDFLALTPRTSAPAPSSSIPPAKAAPSSPARSGSA